MPFVFNTIGVDDGIAMGHGGMKYSLPSRELIADTVERPLFYQDRELPVGVSVGIAVYPDHGRDSETLFKHSDVAMYVAKQNGLAYTHIGNKPAADRQSEPRVNRPPTFR